MCTVSFVPSPEGVFIVSNRDEKRERSNALEPLVYPFPTGNVVFPKDADAGGTWIAMHHNGNAAVLLNGGTEPHDPDPPYRRSRGLVLLDIISHEDPVGCFQDMILDRIEPFTVVIWMEGGLYEGIWTGSDKYFLPKDAGTPQIWSSVTLYDETVRARRRLWFEQWLSQHPAPVLADLLHFHQFTGDGDQDNDLLMNRKGEMLTVSITGMELGPQKADMVYIDLKETKRSYFHFNYHPSRSLT